MIVFVQQLPWNCLECLMPTWFEVTCSDDSIFTPGMLVILSLLSSNLSDRRKWDMVLFGVPKWGYVITGWCGVKGSKEPTGTINSRGPMVIYPPSKIFWWQTTKAYILQVCQSDKMKNNSGQGNGRWQEVKGYPNLILPSGETSCSSSCMSHHILENKPLIFARKYMRNLVFQFSPYQASLFTCI